MLGAAGRPPGPGRGKTAAKYRQRRFGNRVERSRRSVAAADKSVSRKLTPIQEPVTSGFGNEHPRSQEKAMTAKKNAKETKPAKVVADPEAWKGRLKHNGGSRTIGTTFLRNQAVQTLWLKHSDNEARDQQYEATIAALIGIGPKDELEGMMAAQLIAAHNAAMECYRRAMIGEQTFEGRRENLAQADKLSRTYGLLEALNHHRGKGQQKVTVEHVHVHAGGQAVVGTVETAGGGDRGKSEDQPHAWIRTAASALGLPKSAFRRGGHPDSGR
jgi:hypothetical protein